MESVTGQALDDEKNDIPDELLCRACGNECPGTPVKNGDGTQICMRCFRNVRYRIVLDENKDMRTIYGPIRNINKLRR